MWPNSSGLVSAFLLKSSMSVSDLSEPSGSSPRSAASSSAMARTWWLGKISPCHLRLQLYSPCHLSKPQQPPMTRTPSSYADLANLAASQRVICRGSSADNIVSRYSVDIIYYLQPIYTLSTQYLHPIYTLSTQYLLTVGELRQRDPPVPPHIRGPVAQRLGHQVHAGDAWTGTQ